MWSSAGYHIKLKSGVYVNWMCVVRLMDMESQKRNLLRFKKEYTEEQLRDFNKTILWSISRSNEKFMVWFDGVQPLTSDKVLFYGGAWGSDYWLIDGGSCVWEVHCESFELDDSSENVVVSVKEYDFRSKLVEVVFDEKELGDVDGSFYGVRLLNEGPYEVIPKFEKVGDVYRAVVFEDYLRTPLHVRYTQPPGEHSGVHVHWVSNQFELVVNGSDRYEIKGLTFVDDLKRLQTKS